MRFKRYKGYGFNSWGVVLGGYYIYFTQLHLPFIGSPNCKKHYISIDRGYKTLWSWGFYTGRAK